MDWPLDHRALADADLSKVFRFAPQVTTVIRFLKTDPVSFQPALRQLEPGSHLTVMLGSETMVHRNGTRLG